MVEYIQHKVQGQLSQDQQLIPICTVDYNLVHVQCTSNITTLLWPELLRNRI